MTVDVESGGARSTLRYLKHTYFALTIPDAGIGRFFRGRKPPVRPEITNCQLPRIAVDTTTNRGEDK